MSEETKSKKSSRAPRASDPMEPSPGVPERLQGEEISLLDLVNVLLRYRRTILAFAVVLPVLVVAFAFAEPRTFTATTAFMPQLGRSGGSSRLSSLAGQFGIDVPSAESGQSPQFYADLLTSRAILASLVTDTFTVADTVGLFSRGRLRGSLGDLLEIEAETAGRRRVAVIRWLRDRAISASIRETGVIHLSVRTRWPELSGAIAARLVDLVNEFNLDTRQSQAGAERRFIEDRLTHARSELRAAENELEAFLRNNRQFQNSPELVFQYDRLERQVGMRQQVVTSLAEAYEQARISEVRNTPVLTVVEQAEFPVRPDSRRLPLKAALGVVLGGMLGVFVAFGREYGRRSREEGAGEYSEFSTLWSDTKADVVGLVRTLRRS